MTKLHQLVAVEKDVKAAEGRKLTAAYHAAQKPALFNGFDKTYTPAVDGGRVLPPERLITQASVVNLLDSVFAAQARIIDLAATKDAANQQATAAIVVDGAAITVALPVTTLLWLEKQLVDIRTFATSLPTLATDDLWMWDSGNGSWHSSPVTSLRQVDEPQFITVAPATDKHQATVVEKKRNVVEGTWTTVKRSTAMPATRRQALLDRVDKLIVAVKTAREEANSIDVVNVEPGADIMRYLFG